MSIKYYNGSPSSVRHKPSDGVSFDGEPVVTIQSAAADCDIHIILKKYQRGQISIADMNKDVASMLYGDFSQVKSLQDMYQMVEDAKELFNQLPTAVKEQFGFDPRSFVKAAGDEANRGLFEKLGLIEKKPVVSPAPKGSGDKPDTTTTT